MIATADNLVEERWHELSMSASEALGLADLGRRLASRVDRFGTEIDSEYTDTRSVIDVQRGLRDGEWRVLVRGSVGLIRVGDRTISVQPKIPMTQFLDLLKAANGIGRTVGDDAAGEYGESLSDLVETWFLDAATHVVAHGLLRDYVERDAALQLARGSVDQLATARSLLTGTLAVHCRYEEHELNTPFNRMLKAGLNVVAWGGNDVRARRAARLLGDLRVVGRAEPADWRHQVDRRTRVYEPGITLARMLVDGTAVSLDAGAVAARCFLVRSAEVFEAGIRALLAQQLDDIHVTKRSFLSTTGGVRFSPDIVIERAGKRLIADVKYRDYGVDWDSNTRNQIVAFAAAAKSSRAAVIAVERTSGRSPRPFQLPGVDVTPVSWCTWSSDPERRLTEAISAALLA